MLSFSLWKNSTGVIKKIFGRYIFFTNVGISVVLTVCGDAIVQYRDILYANRSSWNNERSLHMGVAGLTVGVPSHFWYVWLDSTWKGSTAKIVAKKVVADQLFSPVLIIMFFFTLGVLEQTPSRILDEELRGKAPKLFLAECCVWPLAQTLNFAVLPGQLRVLYVNTVALVMDMYSSYLKYDTD